MNPIFEKGAWRDFRASFFYEEELFHAAKAFPAFPQGTEKRKALKY